MHPGLQLAQGGAAGADAGAADESGDPGAGRIWVQREADGGMALLLTKEATAALLSVLERRGRREAELYASLQRAQVSPCISICLSSLWCTSCKKR